MSKRAGIVLLTAAVVTTFVLVILDANGAWGLAIVGVFAGGLWLADRP